MENLGQKARVLSLAWLHQVADAAIDAHSIPVVQQYIRDLEKAMSDLREAQATNTGSHCWSEPTHQSVASAASNVEYTGRRVATVESSTGRFSGYS